MSNTKIKMKALGYKIQDISRGMFICSSENKMKLYNEDKLLYDIDDAILDGCHQPAPFSRARVYDYGYGNLRELTIIYDDIYYIYIDSNNNIVKADFMMENKDIWLCIDGNKLAFYNKKTGHKNIVRTKDITDGTKVNVGKLIRNKLDAEDKITIKVVDGIYILVEQLFINTTNGETLFGYEAQIYEEFIGFGRYKRDLSMFFAYIYEDSLYEVDMSTVFHETKDSEVQLCEYSVNGKLSPYGRKRIYGHKKKNTKNIEIFKRKGNEL